MKWFSDLKAKRAAKKAHERYELELAAWQDDLATIDRLITVFTAAQNGEDSVPNTMMQKPGEQTLWSAPAIFHETGREPSRYVGGSTGVSLPIGGGVRFKVGAQRGTLVPGAELQMDKDQGVAMLTTERLIFVGPLKTQEWDFDKLLMISTTEDESDYFINVSNRQKTSGVRFSPATGREFNRFLGSAAAAHEHGYEKVIAELEKLKSEALAIEPQLELSQPE
ncbi:MAG: hypothetical protein RL399_95 [Actinomycetota bacterium]|jgi:hypothetical protein